MDIKSPADKHNLVQLGRTLRVWERGAGGLSCSMPAFCLHTGHSTSSPFETLCSKLEGVKKKSVSTAELIFMVYREYRGISWPKTANLAIVTHKIIRPFPFSFFKQLVT